MKKEFIVIPALTMLLLLNLTSFAQKKKKGKEQLTVPTFVMKDGKVVYSEVVDQKGTKSELYKKCLGWYNSFYKNPTGVLRENIVDQKITGKAKFNLYLEDAKSGAKSRAGLMAYSIEISIKEGKYKYDITKINKKGQSYYGIEKLISTNEKEYKYAYATYLIQTDEYMKDLVAKLKKAMSASSETKTEDW